VEQAARRVTLGRIVGVYGIRGWVRIQSYTRPPDNLLGYRHWRIAAAEPYEARVIEARPQGGGFVAQLSDAAGTPIGDRDIAAKLIGAEIQMERAALPPPPEGSYYWADLIGLGVKSVSGAKLGTVTDVTSNGAQDVLVVEENATRRLIPFVKGPIIRSVSLEAGEIVADWEPDY
jgi:16S rRNA processing protein RimM